MKKNIFLTSQAGVKPLVFLQCKKSHVELVCWLLAIFTFSSCKPLKLGTTFRKMAAIFKKSSIFLQSVTYFSLFLEIFPSSWKHFFSFYHSKSGFRNPNSFFQSFRPVSKKLPWNSKNGQSFTETGCKKKVVFGIKSGKRTVSCETGLLSNFMPKGPFF